MVKGGSWSFDGFRTTTRTDLDQIFNDQIFAEFGKTVLKQSIAKSYSSNDVAIDWNANAAFTPPRLVPARLQVGIGVRTRADRRESNRPTGR